MLNSLQKRCAANTLCTVRRCLPLKHFHTLVAMAREKKNKKIPVANTFIIPKSLLSRAVCLITHKKYCGFFRGLQGDFSAALPCPAQLIAHAAEGQRWPGGSRGCWLISSFALGVSMLRPSGEEGLLPWPCRQVGWSSAGAAPAPVPPPHGGEMGAAGFSAWVMSFLAASYSGKGPSAHMGHGFQEG